MQTELVFVQEVLALLPQRRGEQVAVVHEPRRFGRPLRAALDGGSMLLSRDRGEGVEVRYRARAAAAANRRKRIAVMLPMVAAVCCPKRSRRTDGTRDEQLLSTLPTPQRI